jgi:PKD repeat protein
MPVAEYRWDFDDGNQITTSTPVVYHGFGSSGNYYVTLTVYAPGATPETDSITHKLTITERPIGGYSFPIAIPLTAKPLTLYLATVAILAFVFTMVKRRTRRRAKESWIDTGGR